MRTIQDQKCSVCGEAATAEWRGENLIAVCARCAVKVLPALIADAIFLPDAKHHPNTSEIPAAIQGLERLTGSYWYAIACRVAR